MAFYVIPQVINHALGLISYDVMEGMRLGMKEIWGPPIGELVLLLAFLTHFLLSLFARYRRSTLRMPFWETLQIGLGIFIFPMILIHVIGTAIAEQIIGFDTTYKYLISVLWIAKPMRGAQQSLMLLIVWAHLWVGLHFWLRLKD